MIDWGHWHNEPYLIGGIILLGWLYAVMTGPLRAHLAPPGTPYPVRQAWLYYSGLMVFYLAVGSPLDQIGERFLFSAHMVQHMLLDYPAALLFMLGIPSWVADAPIRRFPFQSVLRAIFHPLVCGLIFSLVYSIWHMPSLYEWALQNKLTHVVQHLMFFGTALFYWWPLVSPSKILRPSSYPAQMLHVFAVAVWLTPVFAYVTFSPDVLYPTYEFAPRLIAELTPREDQVLAGTIMKIGGLSVALACFGWSFWRWSSRGQATED
jgi:putative membrane protein